MQNKCKQHAQKHAKNMTKHERPHKHAKTYTNMQKTCKAHAKNTCKKHAKRLHVFLHVFFMFFACFLQNDKILHIHTLKILQLLHNIAYNGGGYRHGRAGLP